MARVEHAVPSHTDRLPPPPILAVCLEVDGRQGLELNSQLAHSKGSLGVDILYGLVRATQKSEYKRNVAHARESKVGNILGGGDMRPLTPQTKGKKIVSHSSNTPSAAPFATSEGAPTNQHMGGPKKAMAPQASVPAEQAGPRTYVAKSKKLEQGAGKIGAAEFDPSVYMEAQIEKNANLAKQKSKAYNGAGNILHFNGGE
eukprot:gene27166-2405_t